MVGDVVLEKGRAETHGQPLLGRTVLYGYRYAGERTRIARRDPLGLGERPVGVNETEGVDLTFTLFEATKSGLDEFPRVHLSRPEQLREFQYRSHEQRIADGTTIRLHG